MQVLAGNLALSDESAPVADRVKEGIERPTLGAATAALAGEGDESGAISVIVLEAARAQLGAGGVSL